MPRAWLSANAFCIDTWNVNPGLPEYTSWGAIDNLTYTYPASTNKLTNVTDAITGTIGDEGFSNVNATSYTYDANGNLTFDADKGITMTYNHLNLPTKISYSANKYIDMVYDAAGNMLSRRMVDVGLDDKIDYVAGIEFYNGVTQSIMHAEGRVFFTSPTTSRYEYIIRDHLGNARMMYTDLNNDGIIATPTEILWEGQYYPFGLAHKGAFMDAPEKEVNYKYNGIELASDFGLNVNLATFRTLDPATGRWWQVDPQSEYLASMSPYQSMANNPVIFSDPDGDFIPQLVGAVVGVGLNVFNNWDKIVANPWSAIGYVTTGAAAGVVATLPGGISASRIILASGNVITDVVSGTIPEINNFGDFATYAGSTTLNSISTAGSSKALGNLARQGLKNAALKAGKEIGEESLFALAGGGGAEGLGFDWGTQLGPDFWGTLANGQVTVTGQAINWSTRAGAYLGVGAVGSGLGIQNTWDINGPNTTSKWQGPQGSTYSEFGSDGTVWSKSRTGHADSYKVYNKTAKGLDWKTDADTFGNYIDPAKKHKSSSGKFISWKKLRKIL